MSQKTRKILYICFLLTFLITTPMVVMYAIGYTFKFSWPPKFNQSLQKTGMLIIDSEPRGAKIYLNNKPLTPFLSRYFGSLDAKTLTPNKIKNLTPGDYVLRLEAEGYWPWEKKLTVHPGGSTFAENVSLFRNNLPTLLHKGKTLLSAHSNNKENFATVNNNQVFITNQTTEHELSATSSTKLQINAQWSTNDKFVLLNNTIYYADDLTPHIVLKDSIGIDINNIKWDLYSDNKFYYISKGEINSFNTESLTNKLLTSHYASSSDIIIDYLIKNNYLYTIKQSNKNYLLETVSLENNTSSIIKLPNAANLQFINPKNDLLNILSTDKQVLYLIDPKNSAMPLKMTINNIKTGQWIKDDRFLYTNDFEIWLMDTKTSNNRLLTRISQHIKNIIWHPNDNYIIYSTDNAIYIIELDEREKYNITEITKMDQINKVYINEKGDILFFEGILGSQEGLFKLTIQ